MALASPAVRPDVKRATLDRLVPNLPSLVRNFLSILAARDRLGQIPEIAAAFEERVNEERGVVTAEITTAIPLEPALEQTIRQRLGTYFHRDPSQVAVRSRVDPAIIGGVVAQVGDTLIDDSVRGRIARLRRALVAP
jgi:F-type H+-transporting ATPase subunit delta